MSRFNYMQFDITTSDSMEIGEYVSSTLHVKIKNHCAANHIKIEALVDSSVEDGKVELISSAELNDPDLVGIVNAVKMCKKHEGLKYSFDKYSIIGASEGVEITLKGITWMSKPLVFKLTDEETNNLEEYLTSFVDM